MNVVIKPIAEPHIASFHQTLDAVAREGKHLAQVQAPPLERIQEFVRANIAADAVQFVALEGERVVGWADVLPAWAQAISHCGQLGMGLLPEYRGKGIGEQLLRACIEKAWQSGLTRIELEVRHDNGRAIMLYDKLGFAREGMKRNGMRFDGVYYDTLFMSLLAPGSRS
jgi:RimJ/RimL family protein N-acetyltransferase